MRSRTLYVVLFLAGLALLPVARVAGDTPPAWRQAAPQQPSQAIAATAERNGDYTVAEAEYRALAASPDTATAAAGQLSLGRFLERRGRSVDAVAPLQAAIAALGGTPDGLRATFLLGEAQADQQQNQAAAASFQTYLAGGGPAAGYAALGRAAALQADGDDNGALAALAGPLQAASATVRRAALQAASRSHEWLGDPARAAADQQAFVDTQPPIADQANALLEAGRLYQLAGDTASASTALQQLVQQHPSFAAAGKALDRLDALAVAVDPLRRALVLFDLGRSADAQAAFKDLLAANPSDEIAAQATYYLARMADRADQNDAALAGYADAFTLAPTGSLAPEALWRRAQLLNYLSRYGEAQGAYASLVQQFPQSDHAAEAAFESGMMAYLDGRSADAAATWNTISRSAGGGNAARADLWLGKLALAQGDTTTAATALAQAQALQPTGYYGLRAEVLAGGGSVGLSGTAIAPPPGDWGAVESWLAGWAGAEDLNQFKALQATQDWTEGMELYSLGWMTTPNTLLSHALDGVAQQPWALYRAARALADRGRTTLAMEAAEDLLSRVGIQPGSQLNAPAALLRLAYPVDYVDLVNRDAAQNGLDPLLIDAVARQESAFDPAAGSSAGAQGLLQLVLGTAQDEANALGLTSFSAADLKRPLINLQLGSAFLAQQARTHDRDLSQTLAAYNAGGGNAARWVRQAGGDADRFYEAVDFSETRLYIRLVSQNYAVYNELYRGASHATLQHP